AGHRAGATASSCGAAIPILPPMSKDRREPATTTKAPAPGSIRPEVDRFLSQVNALGPPVKAGARGRLVFALDATMSRQPTWDTACVQQADMFRAAASVGGLDIQLVYFRGLNECRASGWGADSGRLAALMSRITCQGGHTRIGRVLGHAKQE